MSLPAARVNTYPAAHDGGGGVEDGLRMAAALLGMHRRQQGEEQSGRETAAHDEGGHGGRARTAENENLQTFERGDGRRHLSHHVASHSMAT